MSNHSAIHEAIAAAHAAGADRVEIRAADLEALFDELTTLRALVIPKPAKRNDYPQEFEDVWALYPTDRQGTKRTAFKAWKANVGRGVDPNEILLGLRRYLAHAAATGKETRYLYLAATFFGPDEHFATKWPVPREQPPARAGKFDPIAHINKPRNEGGYDDGIIDITPR